MDYEDELDRMRARKKRGGASAQRISTERRQERDRAYCNTRQARVSDNGRKRPSESKKTAVQKRKRRKRRILMIEAVVLLILIAVAGPFLLKQRTHQEGYWTIAVFGVDSRDGKLEKGNHSDVEMLCNIDKATGEIKLVSVYRDTYLKINREGTYHKINEAYFKGGHQQAIEALNENLDLQIDDYVTFNWKAVAVAINILGGVDLEITDREFGYINGFITETVNSTGIGSVQLKQPGVQHLDGVQAVSYARLRLMDTDFQRTERQRKVINLAMEKAKQADFATLSQLVGAVFPQVSTSIGMDDVLSMAKGIKKYHIGETAGFPFSRITMKIGKMDCVIPTTLESNVTELHQFLYNKADYKPSSSVKKISLRISKESGISDPGEKTPADGGFGEGKKKNTEGPKETKDVKVETSPEASAEVSKEVTAETVTEAFTEPSEESTEKPTDEEGGLIGPGAHIGGSEEYEESEETKETQKETEKKEENFGPGIQESEPAKEEELPESEISGPGEIGPGV